MKKLLKSLSTIKLRERLDKDTFFMSVALLASNRSTCERLNVGAVIVDKNKRDIVSYGYNGNYAGGPNYCDKKDPGGCQCVHAEINALLKPGRTGEEIMFVTDSPCLSCAKAIINAGITEVYYLREYRLTEGIDLLKRAGIKVTKL